MMHYPVLTVLLLNLLAMTGLSLSMPKHHQQLLNSWLPPLRIWLLRLLAGVLMLMALFVICSSWGIAAGIVLWLGLLSVSAVFSLCLLNHQLLRTVSLLGGLLLVSFLLLI